jgi:hypothetical protein
MNASRNDPCPCGSGRKYKACCLRADVARERVRAVVGDEVVDFMEQVQSMAAAESTWQADVTPMPMEQRDREPAVLLIVAAGMILHVEVLPYRPATAEERAATVAQGFAAARRASSRSPERLLVRDAELAAALAGRPQLNGVAVRAAPMPELDEVLKEFLEHESDAPARLTTPDTWRETGTPAAEVAEFHRAAAEFYRLAPWNKLELQVPLLLALPDGAEWAASIMGDAGVAYGLGLYSQPGDMIALMASGASFAMDGGMQGYSVTVDFDQRGPLSRAMLREITAAGWTIAGPRAYPRLFGLKVERVAAEHVRLATLCLRAVNALARGADPWEETGVGVSPLPLPFGWDEDEDEEDRELEYFVFPERASLMCPEGPCADPEASLRAWDDYEAFDAAENERLTRLEAWLPAHLQKVSKAVLENARTWCGHWGAMAIPAGAVTEHDLRQFIYDLYVRKGEPSKRAVKALRTSLIFIFRFLEEEEGIHYPFGEAVLDELWEVERRAEEDGMELDEALVALSYELYDDLDARVMLPRRDPAEGCAEWPDLMNADVAHLDRELQRRWLLWYDELVRQGMTDFDELEAALLERQIAWENTPHPEHDGQTPAEVIRAYLDAEADPARDAVTA